MISSPRVAATAGLVVTVLSLAACTSSSSTSKSSSAATSSAASREANVTITADKGCTLNNTSVASGPLTLNVSNSDAAAVSEVEVLSGERIVGEKENLPPGFSGSFSLQLDPGSYTLYCPGAKTERQTFQATGTAPNAPDTDVHTLLANGTKTYGQYVTSQVGLLVGAVTPLVAALKGTDLKAAQTAYMKARPYYERIEPVAESFKDPKDLDASIDSRADDVPVSQIAGFHRIEYGLFTAKSLKGLGAIGDGLLADCTSLQKLTAGLTYKPTELANGAADLLTEAGTSKITGEEERYSHIDILDFSANVEGSQQAFANIQPGLAKVDPTLTATIASEFTALMNTLDSYRTSTNASGFVFYGTLTTADKTKLTQGLTALANNVSKIGKLIVNQ